MHTRQFEIGSSIKEILCSRTLPFSILYERRISFLLLEIVNYYQVNDTNALTSEYSSSTYANQESVTSSCRYVGYVREFVLFRMNPSKAIKYSE